jgi:hypothetical protein
MRRARTGTAFVVMPGTSARREGADVCQVHAPAAERRQGRLLGWLAVVSLVLAVAPACSGDSTTALAPTGELVFERADGSRINFSDTRRVYCATFDESDAAPAVHVEGGTPRTRDEAYWTVVADARIPAGDAVAFPSADAYFFVFDQADRANELSSDTEEATGRIVFHELACEPGGAVDFTVDASLGSELAGRAGIRVRGEFRATVARA